MQPILFHFSRRKYCPGCDTMRKVGKFYRNRAHSNGLSTYCKECERARAKVRRQTYSYMNLRYPMPAHKLRQACRCCGEVKLLIEFRKQCDRRIGYATKCKECSKIQRILSASALMDIINEPPQYKHWSDWYLL